MALKSRYWAELTTRDFAALDAQATVAVLPVAAIEQHGPHLPLSVDTLLVDGIVQATLPLLPPDLSVLVLPTQAIGLSPEHERFAGTLTLSPQTLLALWCEIGECVAKSGVRKLLFLNSHGGQVSATDIAARMLRARCELIAYSSSWFNLPIQPVLDAAFAAEEQRFGVHGGAIETSMMLALHPDLVDMSAAQDFSSSSRLRAPVFPLLGNGRSAKFGWQMQDVNPAGAAGDASSATADKGRSVIDAAAAQLAVLLDELSRLPLATLVDRPSSKA
ncbi:MAG: creatininase family protein [Burkholderiaceae bacterium]